LDDSNSIGFKPFHPDDTSDEPLLPGDFFYWRELYVYDNPTGERIAMIRDIDLERFPIL